MELPRSLIKEIASSVSLSERDVEVVANKVVTELGITYTEHISFITRNIIQLSIRTGKNPKDIIAEYAVFFGDRSNEVREIARYKSNKMVKAEAAKLKMELNNLIGKFLDKHPDVAITLTLFPVTKGQSGRESTMIGDVIVKL